MHTPPTTIRWEDVSGVTRLTAQSHLLYFIPIPGTKSYSYVVNLKSGKKVKLDCGWIAASKRLGEEIEQGRRQAVAAAARPTAQ